MSDEKQQTYAYFSAVVNDHYDLWRGNVVVPYSRAYADAYSAYTKTRTDAEADRARKMDLYLAVGMLAGTALCGLGPVAAAIAAGQRPARHAVVALAQVAGRLGIADRGTAWRTMTKFTFGGAPKLATAVWGAQGRDIFKKHLNQFSGGQVAVAASAKEGEMGAIRADDPRDKMPIEYMLELDSLMLKAKNAMVSCAYEMEQHQNVSAQELQEYCDITQKSNFFTQAPRNGVTSERLTKLANEMEMSMWAVAACSWKSTRNVPNVSRSGNDTGSHQVTDYSNYLGEDRVLERIDKLAGRLGMGKYIVTRHKTHNTVITKANWDEYFGMWHSDEEKDDLIKWANTYVNDKAAKVMMPIELK